MFAKIRSMIEVDDSKIICYSKIVLYFEENLEEENAVRFHRLIEAYDWQYIDIVSNY